MQPTLGEGELAAEVDRLVDTLTGIKGRLTQTRYAAYLDICNFVPRMDSRMVYNLNVVYSSDARSTGASVQLLEDLELELGEVLSETRGGRLV